MGETGKKDKGRKEQRKKITELQYQGKTKAETGKEERNTRYTLSAIKKADEVDSCFREIHMQGCGGWGWRSRRHIQLCPCFKADWLMKLS